MAVSTFGSFKQLETSMGHNARTTPTSGFNIGAVTGVVSGVTSAISSVYAARTAAIGFEMQEAARKAQAQQAISEAKLTSLRLKQKFNEIGASNAVMFASQGRSFSSGSIQNILRADQERLQWDLDFTELSGQIGKSAAEADAAGLGMAAKITKRQGIQTGLLQLAKTGTDLARIK